MPSFSFKKQFAPAILAGTKRSTIRETRRCEVGDTVHLFSGLRTKYTHKLGISKVEQVREITMYFNDVAQFDIEVYYKTLEGKEFFSFLCQEEREQLADIEGFGSAEEMCAWFVQNTTLGEDGIYRGWQHVWGTLQ